MYDQLSSIAASLGQIRSSALLNTSAVVGTSAVEFTIVDSPSSVSGDLIKIKIVNRSATADIAWKITRDDTVPAINTTTGSVDIGSIILPKQMEYFVVEANARLFIVASAAGVDVAVTSYLV